MAASSGQRTKLVIIIFTYLSCLAAAEAQQRLYEENWRDGHEFMEPSVIKRQAPAASSAPAAADPGTITEDKTTSFELNEVKDACASNPCQNGGFCNPDSKHPDKKFICACQIGWTRSLCEKALWNCLKCPMKNVGDCVASPKGAICVCNTGGEFCEVIMKSPGAWGTMQDIVHDPYHHLLSVAFGLTVITTILVGVCLSIHCCIAQKKCNKLRESYKADLKEGIVPTEVPPDLLDVSNALCLNMFPCRSISKLFNKDEKAAKRAKSSKTALLADDELNVSTNSLTRRDGRALQRRRDTRTRNYGSRQTGKSRSKLASSHDRYRGVSSLNMNNSLEYEPPVRPRARRESHSLPRRENHTVQYYRDANNYQESSSADEERKNVHHSQRQRLINKTSKLAGRNGNQQRGQTKYPSPRLRYHVQRDISKSPTKSMPQRRYATVKERGNYDHYNEQPYHGKDRDVSLSSGSDEEIYLRPVRKHGRSDEYVCTYRNRNTNTNTNPKASWTAVDDNNDVLASRHLYSEPISGGLSPYAKRNICTHNSITAEPEIEPLHHFLSGNNHGAGDVSYKVDDKYTNPPDYIDTYGHSKYPFMSNFPSGKAYKHIQINEDRQERTGNVLEINETDEPMDFPSQMADDKHADDRSAANSKTYAIYSMRVTVPDSLTANDTFTDSDTDIHDKHAAINDTKIRESVTRAAVNDTKIRESVTRAAVNDIKIRESVTRAADVQGELPDTGRATSEDKMPSEADDDDTYIRRFEDDGKTLYYITEEPRADVDNDIEVIADGKGSLVIVPKYRERVDNRGTVFEVGKAVEINTTEENL